MSEQRGKSYIDKSVQGGLVRRMLGYFLVYLGVSLVIACAVQIYSDPFLSASQHLTNLWHHQGPFLLTAICLLPMFVKDMLQFSHRFVGPVRRASGVIHRATKGDFDQPFKFRENDHWQEMAEDLNVLLDQLRDFQENASEPTATKVEELEPEDRDLAETSC
ncbi:MAG: hypothetical protein COA78_26805 [Blastopirellula sp.]|nr:MAG: hypothetical protein COA78_26805 [Blastopirellula sp.]